MFDKHLFIASSESAKLSARVSQFSSSGRADRKTSPTALNCDGFFLLPFLNMSGIVQVKGGTVLWSRVYCISGIVCLSPLQMLCTTILFYEFCGLTTCFPVVVKSSVIGIVFMRMTLLD